MNEDLDLTIEEDIPLSENLHFRESRILLDGIQNSAGGSKRSFSPFDLIVTDQPLSTITERRSMNMLIVDDSPYNLFVLEEVLKSVTSGNLANLTTALNGQEALKELLKPKNLGKGNICKFDMMFLDLHMPVLDGFSVRARLFTFI